MGGRKFQRGVTEEKVPDMPAYRGLFDEATSQRDRQQRSKWRVLAKPHGLFAGIFQ
jgi:hypothetical protein